MTIAYIVCLGNYYYEFLNRNEKCFAIQTVQ